MPQTKEEKNKEYQKEWYKKNREKIIKKRKEYREKNKEKIKEYDREWYKKNKADIIKKSKEWYENNKEKIKKCKEEYRKTPKGKKIKTISRWKSRGIIADDYNEWYEKYINCNECNFCHKEFKNTKDKHLDHNHSINYCENIRGILCCSCNVKDVFLDILI
jgi:hypothetical protein